MEEGATSEYTESDDSETQRRKGLLIIHGRIDDPVMGPALQHLPPTTGASNSRMAHNLSTS